METAIRINTTTAAASSLNAARRKREAEREEQQLLAAADNSTSTNIGLIRQKKGPKSGGEDGLEDVVPSLFGHVAWISPVVTRRSSSSSSSAEHSGNKHGTSSNHRADDKDNDKKGGEEEKSDVAITMFIFGGMDGDVNKLSNRTYSISLSSMRQKQQHEQRQQAELSHRKSSPTADKRRSHQQQQQQQQRKQKETQQKEQEAISMPMCDADLVITPTAPPARYLHAVAVANPIPVSIPARSVLPQRASAFRTPSNAAKKSTGRQRTDGGRDEQDEVEKPACTRTTTAGFLSRSTAANAAIPGAAYVYGGVATGGFYCDDLWCFNPTTQSWSELACTGQDVPGRRCGHSMAFDASNERLYIVGGSSDDEQQTAAATGGGGGGEAASRLKNQDLVVATFGTRKNKPKDGLEDTTNTSTDANATGSGAGKDWGNVWVLEMRTRQWRLLADVSVVSARAHHRMLPLPLQPQPQQCCQDEERMREDEGRSSPTVATKRSPFGKTAQRRQQLANRQQQQDKSTTASPISTTRGTGAQQTSPAKTTARHTALGGFIVGHGGGRGNNATVLLSYSCDVTCNDNSSNNTNTSATAAASTCTGVKLSCRAMGLEGDGELSSDSTSLPSLSSRVLDVTTLEQQQQEEEETSGAETCVTQLAKSEVNAARNRATQLVVGGGVVSAGGSKNSKPPSQVLANTRRRSTLARRRSTANLLDAQDRHPVDSRGKLILASLAEKKSEEGEEEEREGSGNEARCGFATKRENTNNAINQSYLMHVSASGRYLFEIGGSKDIGALLANTRSTADAASAFVGGKQRPPLADGAVRITDLATDTVLALSTKDVADYALAFKKQQVDTLSPAAAAASSEGSRNVNHTDCVDEKREAEPGSEGMVADLLEDVDCICQLMAPPNPTTTALPLQEDEEASEEQQEQRVKDSSEGNADEQAEEEDTLNNTATFLSATSSTSHDDCTTHAHLHDALCGKRTKATTTTNEGGVFGAFGDLTRFGGINSKERKKNRLLDWIVSSAARTMNMLTSKHHHHHQHEQSLPSKEEVEEGETNLGNSKKKDFTSPDDAADDVAMRNPYRLSNVLGLEGATMCALPSSLVAALAGIPDTGPFAISSAFPPIDPDEKRRATRGAAPASPVSPTASAAECRRQREQHAHAALLSTLGFVFGGRDAATGVMSPRLYMVRFFDDSGVEALFASERVRVQAALDVAQQLLLEESKRAALERFRGLEEFAAALRAELEELQRQEKRARVASGGGGGAGAKRGGGASATASTRHLPNSLVAAIRSGEVRKMTPSALLLTSFGGARHQHPVAGGTGTGTGSVLNRFDLSLDDAEEQMQLLLTCELPILTRHIRHNKQHFIASLQQRVVGVSEALLSIAKQQQEQHQRQHRSPKKRRGTVPAGAEEDEDAVAAELQRQKRSVVPFESLFFDPKTPLAVKELHRCFYPLLLHFVSADKRFFDFCPAQLSSSSSFCSSAYADSCSTLSQQLQRFLPTARRIGSNMMHRAYLDSKIVHQQDILHVRRTSSFVAPAGATFGGGITFHGHVEQHAHPHQQQQKTRPEDILEDNSKTRLPLNAMLAEHIETAFASARSVQLGDDKDGNPLGSSSSHSAHSAAAEQYVLYRSPSTNKWRRRRRTSVRFGEEHAVQQRAEEERFRRNVRAWEQQTRRVDLHTRYEALMAELRPYGLHKAAPVSEVVMQSETMKTLRSCAPPRGGLHSASSGDAHRRRQVNQSFDPDPTHVPQSRTREWFRHSVVTEATREALAQRLVLSDAAAHDYALDYKQGVDTRHDSRTSRCVAEAECLSRRVGLLALGQLQRMQRHKRRGEGDDAGDEDEEGDEEEDENEEEIVVVGDDDDDMTEQRRSEQSSVVSAVAPPDSLDPAVVTSLHSESAHDRFVRTAHRRAVLNYTREALLRERFGVAQATPHRHQPPGLCTVDYARDADDDDDRDDDDDQEENQPRTLSPTALEHYHTTQHTVPRPIAAAAGGSGGAVSNAHSDNGQGLVSARAAMDATAVFTMDGIRRSLDGTTGGRLTKQAMVEATRNGELGEYMGWGNRIPLRPTHRQKERPSRLRR